MLSPIHPATWYANGAIALGVFVGVSAFARSLPRRRPAHALLAGVGLVLVALAIEISRVVARIERRRAFLGEPARPTAHPYRPAPRRRPLDLLRAEFADESRWRDVLYVAINLPLSVIEFFVAGTLWTARCRS